MALFRPVSGRHVLVVDDDADIRELLVAVLSDDGYETKSAWNGRVALDLLERGWRADVVVLDLMMPVMDGWTFADHIHKKDMNIPIVVLSAATDVHAHATRIGAADVVAKPFDLDALLPCIARVAGGAA